MEIVLLPIIPEEAAASGLEWPVDTQREDILVLSPPQQEYKRGIRAKSPAVILYNEPCGL